jgi:hypothetical protein
MNLRVDLQAFVDSLRIHHVRGKKRPAARIVLLCRVENGEEWIMQFLAHYRQLGVDHMIFLDTGSTDKTLDLLQGPDVTVYSTALPFKTHRLWMRRWLMSRCAPGTWTVNVDVDELFIFPSPFGGEVRGGGGLLQLISYFDHHHYTAMRAHMLDMFASGPLGSRDAPADAPLQEQYPWYDVSDIHPITDSWIFREPPALRGGIRKTIFGRDHFWLTKHPLIKTEEHIRAFEESEHGVIGAHVADVTGVLLHYKFTPSFRRYVEESVRRGQHWNESEEYKAYQSILKTHPHLTLKRNTAERWQGIDHLVTKNFVQMSDIYRQMLRGSSTSDTTGASSGAE